MRKLEVRRATGWKAHASRIRHLTNTRLSFGPGHRNNTVPFDLQVLSLVYRRSVTRHFFHINYGQNNPHCLAQFNEDGHFIDAGVSTANTTPIYLDRLDLFRMRKSELLSGVGGENASYFISSNRNFYLKSGVKMPPIS